MCKIMYYFYNVDREIRNLNWEIFTHADDLPLCGLKYKQHIGPLTCRLPLYRWLFTRHVGLCVPENTLNSYLPIINGYVPFKLIKEVLKVRIDLPSVSSVSLPLSTVSVHDRSHK